MLDDTENDIEATIRARRRIYLLRHGAVRYFDARGQPLSPDAVPLDEDGRAQALSAAAALRPVALDRVIASGLPRTVETASFILAGRDVTLEIRDDLREIAPGKFVGREAAQLAGNFAGALRGRLRRESVFLGGETFGALIDRVVPAFVSLVNDDGWRELAIVAHGGTNRAILCHALGAGIESFAHFEQDPGCLNVIDVDADGTLLVRLVNFTPLAAAKEGLRATSMESIWLSHIEPRAARWRAENGDSA